MSDTAELKKGMPWLFYISLIGSRVGSAMAGTYLSFYMTNSMGLAATLMGTILLVSRGIDIFTGFVLGPFMQKHCGRFGQFRTWILYGSLVLNAGVIVCFMNPSVSIPVKSVIVFAAYIIYGLGASLLQLAQNGTVTKVAGPNVKSRQLITAKIFQGQQTGMILTSMLALPVIQFFSGLGMDGYTVTVIIFGVISVSCQIGLFIGSRDFDKYDPNFKANSAGASVKTWSMYTNALKNKQLLILMLADTFRYLGTFTIGSLAMYFFTYVSGNQAMMTLNMTVQSFSALAGAFLMPPVARKIGKKRSAIATGIIGLIGYGGIALISRGNPYLYIFFNALSNFGLAVIFSCGVNLFLDAGEYQLYKTGQDNRTLAISLYGIPLRVGLALSSMTVALALNVSGYDAATRTVASTGTMGLMIGGISAVCFLLSAAIMSAYSITEEKSKEYAEHNHKNTINAKT